MSNAAKQSSESNGLPFDEYAQYDGLALAELVRDRKTSPSSWKRLSRDLSTLIRRSTRSW